MKKTVKLIAVVLSMLMVLTLFAACGKSVPREGLWKDATYLADKTFGEGATTVTVVVTAEDKSVTFTVKTDKAMLGEALEEFGLIAKGSKTYYTIVNGITADWDTEQSYWAFYIGGEYASTGLDDTPVTGGATYALTYTK